MAGIQPTKNAEKANIVKALREQFPLDILLPIIGLKRSTFFYHLTDKVDKNAEIVQKVVEIYHENQGNYG
ncbi:Uncharacterised protein [[Pasteurella] mairii]|uniref:Uncharacterized protein n=1 Tax=[Pasteurella] mairii TaxID=757 RepID=A0A379B4Q7_9PAST|nr:Uncharacterised protein [[Pasteurella] mairii]